MTKRPTSNALLSADADWSPKVQAEDESHRGYITMGVQTYGWPVPSSQLRHGVMKAQKATHYHDAEPQVREER